ncbi:MAG: PLP-dependent cysteine synthase family protein [Halanaeroarchaeum sp.]
MTQTETQQRGLLATIGDTPLVDLPTETTTSVHAKLETFNPGGSVKDRIGRHIIERLLERGDLEPGGRIIEPTAGNTGIGMAIAAGQLGVDATFVVPRGFSEEKETLMAALGADIVHTPSDGGMDTAKARARELADDDDEAVVPDQFSSQWNVEAHHRGTGQEIVAALDGQVGAFVAGIGSGGTLMGVQRAIREVEPDVHVVAVEPEGSTYGTLLGEERTAAAYKTEGIGTHEPAVTSLLDPSVIDDIQTVSDRDAHEAVRRLAAEDGLLVGSSSGAASVAARRVAAAIDAGEIDAPHETVVTVFPDGSERYLSKNLYGSFEEWGGK